MTSSSANSVTKGLNLSLPLRDPSLMFQLLTDLVDRSAEIKSALEELHYVHYARFLPANEGKILLVITEYDGDFESYVMDFAMTIGDVFSRILKDVDGYDAAWLPVKDHPQEFFAFIQEHNQVTLQIGGKPSSIEEDLLFSVYPQKTVLNILGPRTNLPKPVLDAPIPTTQIDLADVQGNILKGYRGQLARHFALEVTDAALARSLLVRLVTGDASCPKVTTAVAWTSGKPAYCLNAGFTFQGLLKLGVNNAELEKFPGVFQEGPADLERATKNGDFGDSDRRHWVLGGKLQPVHIMLSLYADVVSALDHQTALLKAAFNAHAVTMVHAPFDAQALHNDTIHFGYRDGISQPRIAGFHNSDDRPDMQPLSSAGEFLLGADYLDVYGGKSLGSLLPALAQNATYTAVRIMAQDVEAFDNLLDSASKSFGIDRELVAAKLMGRWRDGTPLSTLNPTHAKKSARDYTNSFDYAPSAENPGEFDDYCGDRCPVGAHIRRMNPRSAMVAGKPHTRRIIRRGLPYSWPSADGISKEQGVIGLFICADLNRQFEFLLRTWANGDIAANGVLGTKDPIVGAQPETSGLFRFSLENPAKEVAVEVPRLVKTRGSVYLLMPGIGGLRYLSTLHAEKESLIATKGWKFMNASLKTSFLSTTENTGGVLTTGGFSPAQFDPTTPAFLQNPYPSYAEFRKNAPVAKVNYPAVPSRKPESSFWVFNDELIKEVCGPKKEMFLKKIKDSDSEKRGLFTMDPPDHTHARALLDPMVAAIIATATASAQRLSGEILTGILSSTKKEIDFVAAFAEPLTQQVFFEVFGLSDQNEQQKVAEQVSKIFEYVDITKSDAEQEKAEKATTAMATKFYLDFANPFKKFPAGTLLALLKTLSGNAIHRAGHAASFCVGGYLSNQFLLAQGLQNILGDTDAKAAMVNAVLTATTKPNLLKDAIDEIMRFDAPLQMADRYAAQNTSLGGVAIQKDDRVTLVFGSANRDVKRFPSNPDMLDLTRGGGPGFAFGHGIHECIAYALTYTVATEGFKALFTRLPNLALKNSIAEYWPSPYYRRINTLMVKF